MTTTVTRRRTNPINEVLSWLEGEPFSSLRGLGLTPDVRIEDFMENATYVIRAEMPGIDPEKDVDISIEGDLLTILGERREEHQERDHREFQYGAFTRTLVLPKGTDSADIKASYVDGILELRVPLTGEQSEPRRIPVQRAEA